MLRYLNSGERRYGLKPLSAALRKNWEYQAVLQGRCAPVLRGGEPLPMRERTLWVFPPETAHGWTCPPAESCEIVVMHFSQPPDAVRSAAEPRGWLEAELGDTDIARLRELHDAVKPHVRRLTSHSEVVFDHAMLELSLIALREQPAHPLHGADGYARRKVEQALAWYAEHLAIGPGVAALAKAVYVSPPHLRRLFHEATGESPLAAMQRLRLDRAKHLMATTDLPLKEIAAACGFRSPSVFSRTFTRIEGPSPRSWRDRSRTRIT